MRLTNLIGRARNILGIENVLRPAEHVTPLGRGQWELGVVDEIHLLEPGQESVTVIGQLRQHAIRMIVDADQKMQFVGGQQRMNLDRLGVSKERQADSPVILGPVFRFVYVSGRSGSPERYQHKAGYEFGSSFDELPILAYWPSESRMDLMGGVYRVGRRSGIVC